MNETLNYYEKNAESFSEGTLRVDFTETQERFLRRIPDGGKILDFGCGAGRDTKYFSDRGYFVHAIDGSEALCKIATEYSGVAVKQMLFQDLEETDCYDGIWACASILHLSKDELYDVIHKMSRAVKPRGYIYISFKYGAFAGYRNGRYFTDFTEETFRDFLKKFSELSIEEHWVSSDVRPDRGEEKWLNLILRSN